MTADINFVGIFSKGYRGTDVQNLAGVAIQLTHIPVNAKRQAGFDDESDIFWAGWFAFTSGATHLTRSPIHYRQSFFEVPYALYSAEFAIDGYVCVLYEAYEAAVLEYLIVQEG